MCFQLIIVVYSRPFPQEIFDKCLQSCNVDQDVLDRCNVFNFKDTPQDHCVIKCALQEVKLLKPNGDLKIRVIRMFAPELDLSPLKVINVNEKGFIDGVVACIEVNRKIYQKV